jgi:hypothetical protein
LRLARAGIVWILMAARARPFFKQILMSVSIGGRLVTIRAGNGGVRTFQIKSSLTMPYQRERGWRKAVDGVTTLTPVRESRAELAGMNVLVAILAA